MGDHLEYNEFIQSFKAQASELEDALAQVANGKALDANTIDQLSLSVTKLRSAVTEAVAVEILPAYDQRLCEQRVASLEGLLSKARTDSKPKSKFSFKSARKAPTTLTPESIPAAPVSTPALQTAPATASTTKIALNDHTGKILTLANATGLETFASSGPVKSVVVTIGGLTDCFVDLTSTGSLAINALHVQSLKRTVLYAGNVQGSVLLHDCVQCTIIISAHQFRMHTSCTTNVYLKISSNPVVEKCNDIRFGPFPSLPTADPATGSHSKLEKSDDPLPYVVQDFDWMGTGQSPNWSSVGSAPFRLPDSVTSDNLASTLHEMLPKPTS